MNDYRTDAGDYHRIVYLMTRLLVGATDDDVSPKIRKRILDMFEGAL